MIFQFGVLATVVSFRSTRPAYQVVMEDNCEPQVKEPLFTKVWKWEGPKRYKGHLWKVAHEHLLTNVERVRRNMANEDLCPRCQQCPETIMHVIHGCEEVQQFWYTFVHPDQVSRFFSLGLEGWLNLNLSYQDIDIANSMWSTFFGIVMYELWRDRNRLVFSASTMLGEDLGRYCQLGPIH